MDPKIAAAHAALAAMTEFFGRALAESAQREQTLRDEVDTCRKQIAQLQQALTTKGGQ